MPTRDTTDISHNELTDHDIEARPVLVAAALDKAALQDAEALVPVAGEHGGDRSFGLAYAQLADRGDRAAGETALELLNKAEKEGRNDAELHTQLGFLSQMSGDGAKARKEYLDALAEDRNDVTAMANLAVLDAGTGRAYEAVRLLQKAIDDNPAKTSAGLNLAFIECRMNQKEQARALLRRLSTLNPDDPVLLEFASKGVYEGQRCDLR
jgi:Flp pilus assembly protein TadD